MSTGPDIVLKAVDQVFRAGLERDAEIRAIVKEYIEKTYAFVSTLDDSREGREQRSAIWNRDQNPKSLPSAFINQATAAIGLGVTFDPATKTALTEALQHPVLIPGKTVAEYYRSKIGGSEAARVFAIAYLRLLETPRELAAIREMLEANDFMFRIDDVGNMAGRYLFRLEMDSPGWLAKLSQGATNDEMRSLKNAQLKSTPLPVDASVDERARTWTTLKTLWQQGLVSDELMLQELMRFDVLKIDRPFAIEFMKDPKRRDSFGMKDIILNRAALATLEGRLNTTQATFLALTLPKSVSEAIINLREQSANLTLKSRRWGGDEFRGTFESLTLAALFANNSDFESNQPRSRMPEVRNIFELIDDLDSGRRQRGADFDRAVSETRESLLITAARRLRAGDAKVLEVFERETAAIEKRLGESAGVKSGIVLATSAVALAVDGLSGEKLGHSRDAFVLLADKDAITKITGKRPPAQVRGRAARAGVHETAAQQQQADFRPPPPQQQQQPQVTLLQQQQQVGRQLNPPGASLLAMALGCEMAFVSVK